MKPDGEDFSISKELKNQYDLEIKSVKDKKLKEDKLVDERVNQLIKKEKKNNNDNIKSKYLDILKNVQGSSFFNKFLNELQIETPTSVNKRTNICHDSKSPSYSLKDKFHSDNNNRSIEKVDNKDDGIEERKYYEISSFKNFTLNNNNNKNENNNIRSNDSTKTLKQNGGENFISSNFLNKIDKDVKPEDVFENYQYHNYINKKFNKKSSSKNFSKNIQDSDSNKNFNSLKKLPNENSFYSDSYKIDYNKLYNIKRSEDHDAFSNFNIFDPNLENKEKKINYNNINLKKDNKINDSKNQLDQEEKLISKLKSFVIEMPNDDDIFNINQDFFEKKTTITSNGLDDRNGTYEDEYNKKKMKRRSSLPSHKYAKQNENESFYSKKIYKNHQSNIFGMFNNI